MVTMLPRGLAGAGLFVRQAANIDPARLRELGIRWVCVSIRVQRGSMNRDLAWYRRALAVDLVLTAFDWLPHPSTWRSGFDDAIAFARDAGCVAFILNAEKDFRGRANHAAAEAYAARADELRGDMALGLVSYSQPQTVRDFPWAAFAERCEIGIPEVYDREGAYDPRYDDRAIGGYREAGFRHVFPACGIYQRDTTSSPWRWRKPDEVRRHMAIYEQPPEAWLAWPIGADMPPEATLRALADPWP